MLFRSLAIASFVATATGQAVAPPGGCLVCGDGNVVMAPDAVFTFPGEPEVPCGTLQEAGLGGLIPLDQCPFLPGLIASCECAEGELPTEAPAPTVAPVPIPTEAPVPPPSPPSTQAPITQAPISPTDAPGSCPDVPTTGCSVCGEGLCVGNPDAIFVFPGQPEVSCGVLQEAGLAGGIPLNQCPSLPGLVAVCECGPGATIPPSPAPTDTPGSCPEVPTTGCSVCGEGKGLCVGNPGAIFIFPGQPEVSCGDLQEAGLAGGIPLDQCPSLPPLVAVCECGPGATIPPSPAPTIDPTPAPSSTPTIDPTPAPSSTPIIDPTPVPVVEPTMAPVPVTEQPTTDSGKGGKGGKKGRTRLLGGINKKKGKRASQQSTRPGN